MCGVRRSISSVLLGRFPGKRSWARVAAGAPLFASVSRLTRQKGVDLLMEALPRLVREGAQLVLVGVEPAGVSHHRDRPGQHRGGEGEPAGPPDHQRDQQHREQRQPDRPDDRRHADQEPERQLADPLPGRSHVPRSDGHPGQRHRAKSRRKHHQKRSPLREQQSQGRHPACTGDEQQGCQATARCILLTKIEREAMVVTGGFHCRRSFPNSGG